jgi:hypothetical protein
MALVCPNSSELLLLKYIVGLVAAGNPVLHLYSNIYEPGEDTVIGSLTEILTSTGYAPVTLTSSSWTVEESGGVTTAVYPEQTFTFTGTANAHGYYVTDTAGALLWVEMFSGAPFEIPDGGGTISITSKLTLS